MAIRNAIRAEWSEFEDREWWIALAEDAATLTVVDVAPAGDREPGEVVDEPGVGWTAGGCVVEACGGRPPGGWVELGVG